MWTDFICLLPLQSKVNRKGPTSWIPKFEHFYFASNFKYAYMYLSLEIVKCPKYNRCSKIMCPAIYCFKTNTVSTLAFLCTCSTSQCRYADLHHCQETFSVIKHFLEVIGFLYNFFLWNSYYALFMTFFTCPDEAYLKEGNVRMWLSLVFLCPRDKVGGGGILIYPCPSGCRYMVCSAISSYSFKATALIFCRMFIHIMEMCMSTGFLFYSNILKMTGSWTSFPSY
jgi:hypothetical protein